MPEGIFFMVVGFMLAVLGLAGMLGSRLRGWYFFVGLFLFVSGLVLWNLPR